eukprot:1901075-Alexandrium_andersonii.AAC.1
MERGAAPERHGIGTKSLHDKQPGELVAGVLAELRRNQAQPMDDFHACVCLEARCTLQHVELELVFESLRIIGGRPIPPHLLVQVVARAALGINALLLAMRLPAHDRLLRRTRMPQQ